jgi:hypothetical protein
MIEDDMRPAYSVEWRVRLLTVLYRLGQTTGWLAALTGRAIPRAAYASDDARVVLELSIGCICALHGWGYVTGGTGVSLRSPRAGLSPPGDLALSPRASG